MHLLALGALLLAAGTAISQTETPPKGPQERIYPEGVISLSQDPHFSPYSFVVDKSKRTLRVYKSEGDLLTLVEEHPTDMGKNSGEKKKANDHKTPVGIYFLMAEKTQPEIPFGTYGSLAFTTDYPNVFDKREAKGGNGIWLHAVPDKVPLTRGSRGCVVVRNKIIHHLAQYVKLGQTPLIIAENMNYLTAAEYIAQKKKYLDHFELWRKTWEQSDVDAYIEFYDPTFKIGKMDKKKWYDHKKKLKSLYEFIKVSLLPPTILRNKDQVVIRTAQNYESNLHKDYGEKTIHAHFSDQTGFKIIREEWAPITEALFLPEASNSKARSVSGSPNL